MGSTLDKKKSILSLLIFVSYLISYIGIRLYLENNLTAFYEDYGVYIKVNLIIGLPLALSTLYVFYSLKEKLVFKVLIFTHILSFLIFAIGTTLGYFDSHIIYFALFTTISNIKFIIYLSLIIVAVIQKEKVLTFIYLSISIVTAFISSASSLINRVISVVNDQDQILMIIKVLSYSQMLLQLFMVIVLILLFYKYGETNNKNKIKKENQLTIENY